MSTADDLNNPTTWVKSILDKMDTMENVKVPRITERKSNCTTPASITNCSTPLIKNDSSFNSILMDTPIKNKTFTLIEI